MSGIPEATPIRLTAEERTELEGLARSSKTETAQVVRDEPHQPTLGAEGQPRCRNRGCCVHRAGTADRRGDRHWRTRRDGGRRVGGGGRRRCVLEGIRG